MILANNGGNPINGTFEARRGYRQLAAGTPLTEGTVLSSNFLGSGLYASITYQAGAGHDSVAIIVRRTDLAVSIGGPSTTLTNTGPVTFTVTYTDAESDFLSSNLSATNVHLVSTGNAAGTLGFDAGSGQTRTVTISNITGNGTLAIAIDAGSASDQAGNTVPAASSTTFAVDTTLPTSSVTIANETASGYSPGTFTISWANGSDNGGGDQITGYTVYVSDNGGSFTPITGLTNTTQTSGQLPRN